VAALDLALADPQVLLHDRDRLLALRRGGRVPRPGRAGRSGCAARVARPALAPPSGLALVHVEGAVALGDLGQALDLAFLGRDRQGDAAAAHALGVGVAVLVRQEHVAKRGPEPALVLSVIVGRGGAGARVARGFRLRQHADGMAADAGLDQGVHRGLRVRATAEMHQDRLLGHRKTPCFDENAGTQEGITLSRVVVLWAPPALTTVVVRLPREGRCGGVSKPTHGASDGSTTPIHPHAASQRHGVHVVGRPGPNACWSRTRRQLARIDPGLGVAVAGQGRGEPRPSESNRTRVTGSCTSSRRRRGRAKYRSADQPLHA
jgi:hypothetical protein